MKGRKKSKRANGGKATFRKYGPDHFRKLARQRNEKYFGTESGRAPGKNAK